MVGVSIANKPNDETIALEWERAEHLAKASVHRQSRLMNRLAFLIVERLEAMGVTTDDLDRITADRTAA